MVSEGVVERYDAVIVGAGPAGVFAALALTERPGLRVVVLDKGPSLSARRCPMKSSEGRCLRCSPCRVLSGWGGAGAYSDGKLTLTPEFGGNLASFIGKKRLVDYIARVDEIYMSYGISAPLFEPDPEVVSSVSKTARRAGLTLVPARIRHLGSDRAKLILQAMFEDLSRRAEVLFGHEVVEVLAEDGRAVGVRTSDGKTFLADFVVLAPGREGAVWLEGVARKLSLEVLSNPVDIGVRVEIPAEYAEELTDRFYELKLLYNSPTFDDMVRTFCMCPHGEVVLEHVVQGDVLTVNGHSLRDYKTDNTNFAVLVSVEFTQPFKDPIGYGIYVARLANMLGGGALVQRLGDLRAGRRSTPSRIARNLIKPTLSEAMPGDLSFVFPYRHLKDIVEMIEALDVVIPGVNSNHTLLYGVEVKFYSVRFKLSPVFETQVSNLFAVGDGAGITRGLAQASVSGMLVGEEIRRRIEGRG